jgi:SOS-response transcriptional repressor LexA
MVTKEPEHSVVFGLRITGDDMDKYYPPGHSTVMCVPYEQYARELGSGDHVVVERADGNGQYEITVKEIFVKDGHVWLMPHSGNPSYKPLQILKTDGAAGYYGTPELKITGVVLKAIIDHVPQQANENRPLLPKAL